MRRRLIRVLRSASLTALALGAVACSDGDVEVDEAPTTSGPVQAKAATPPPPPSKVELKNGLIIETLVPGDGAPAAVGDSLSIHYSAHAVDEEEALLTTRASGIPFRFTLGRQEVIRGLDRGLLGARTGAQVQLTVPSALAYGEDGLDPVAPDTDLIFEVDVISVTKAP